MDNRLFSLRERNILIGKICAIMSLLGCATSFMLRGPSAWPILACALILLPVLLYFIVNQKFVNQTKYIATLTILIFHFTVLTVLGDLVSFCFTYVLSPIISLYFNFRVLLLMGAGNILLTIYFFKTNLGTWFDANDPKTLVPFVLTHIFITTALVSQAIIGENMRIKTLSAETLSKTDALTGLNNHRAFYEHMETLLEKKITQQLQLAILDIDNFKKINDTYGHHAGDLILKRVANEVSKLITPQDIAARYGGEEFAIIFVNKSMDEALRLSNQIVASIREIHPPETNHQPVTVSLGLKNYSSIMQKEEWFIEADKLLYKAKKQGKDRAVSG